MKLDDEEILLDIQGLGILFYSPVFAEHIAEGEDYLAANYWNEEQVQAHIQKGTIVSFCTSSPGVFCLQLRSGYPTPNVLNDAEFKLRLGLHCSGGEVCFRDLYDLMQWRSECPATARLNLEDGFYHVTLCSNRPDSGIIGDRQMIQVYLQKLDAFPALSRQGIPTLCF